MSEASTIEPVEAIPDLKYWCKGDPSEVGKRVARMLAIWAGGSHHLDANEMAKVDWRNPAFIEVRADSSTTCGGLSTVDFGNLTNLVFLAHDHCIRVTIMPLSKFTLRFLFHPRSRQGPYAQRHPTIETALAQWRKQFPAPAIPDAQPQAIPEPVPAL